MRLRGKFLSTILAVAMVFNMQVAMPGSFIVPQSSNVQAEETVYYSGNPFVTSMFTADPSAHVWEEDGRIYVYASHDIFPSRGCDLMDKYHVFSSDNMVTWKDEGEILSSDDVSWGREEGGFMWAPDAAYKDGTYYFYFPHPTGSGDTWNSTWRIGIAKSNSPADGFTCADDGYIKKKDGTPYVTCIDPCVFQDDDGTFYLYTGGGSQCYVAKLSDDMQTLAEEPVRIDGTLTDFHEGMWIFKKDGIYYALYADNTGYENQMRYSTSNSPYGPWREGGVVLEGTGCDTSHGSIVEYKGHWYLFYHNCEISGNGTLRSICVDEVFFNKDGSIQTVVQTDKGVAAVDYVDPAELAASSSSPNSSAFTEKTNYSIFDAVIGGDATLGSTAIENLHYEGSTVTWNNIDGGKGGQAMLNVYYGTPDGGTALVNSSGDTAGDGYFLKFDKTTGWGDYSGVATCYIDLNAGTNNTVKLTCGMGGINITGMSVSLKNQTIEETTQSPTQNGTIDGQPVLMEVFDSPADGDDWYDEMYPLGNGNIGASVYGGVEVDSILINEKTLWSGGSQEYSEAVVNFEYTGGLSSTTLMLSEYANRAQTAWKQARKDLQAAVNTHSENGNEDYNIPQSVTNTINQMKGDKSNFGSYQELGDINIIEPEYIEPYITRIYADKEHRGGVSASEASASLFDGNVNTKYYADAVGGGNVAPYTIEWDYSMPKALESYTFTTGNDAEGRDPVAWTLYASAEAAGENYVQIDQRTDTAAKDRFYSTTYRLTTPGKYLRYRLVVTQVRDGGQMQLSEITLNSDVKKMQYSNYRRTLSLDEAIANVSYESDGKKYNREYFVSNPDNVMVIKLDANGSNFSKFFRITTEQKTRQINTEIAADGSGVITITGQPTPDAGFVNKTGFDKALYYAMEVKVIPTGGRITQVDDGIQVDNATSILLIMSAGTNYKLSKSKSYTDFFTGVDPMIAVKSNVNNAVAKGYEALKKSHIADYKNLYDRVKLQLEDATVPTKTTEQLMAGYENTNTDTEDRYLETLYYQFGRYLLIASSRENSLLPANLQGIWADGLTPPWSADYHTNINLQMNYWLSESTNLSETHEPVLEYIESLVEKGRQGVQTVFGTNEAGDEIRGWTIWHENNPWGNIAPAVSDAFYAPEDGAWMCRDIWDRYEFTMDKKYLAENYDILKQAALFWVDTLWVDTRDNTLVVNPSYSPEHGPYSLGATEAQSVVWGLFDEVIKASEILGVEDSEIAEIRDAMSRLSGLKIGSAGQLQEWKDDTQLDITGDYGHRHVNHLYGLHPGDQIVAGRSEEDDKYVEAAKVTLNTRGDGGTGWSKAWKINFWARLLDGEHAQTMVKQILKESTITNLLDEHPPFQIDGNFGATSGMTEMLLQSQGGIIKLLPAISTEWSSGQVTGLKARGNVEVGIKWSDNTLTGATLKTLVDGTITVSAPGIANMSITRAGQNIVVQKVDSNTIKIDAVKGAVYVVGETFGNIKEDVEEGPKLTLSDDVNIKGYQISTTLGGFRVVGSVAENVNESKVQSWGLVYALSEVNGQSMNVSDDDIYVGSENQYVVSYESTSAGTLKMENGKEDTTYFVRTMTFTNHNKAEFTAEYKVRAYAVLENGEHVYSDVYSYSIYKISDYLYKNELMTSASRHNYLYDKILNIVDSTYGRIEFDVHKAMYK